MSAPFKTPEVSRVQREAIARSKEALRKKEEREASENIAAAVRYKPRKIADDSGWDFSEDNEDRRD